MSGGIIGGKLTDRAIKAFVSKGEIGKKLPDGFTLINKEILEGACKKSLEELRSN